MPPIEKHISREEFKPLPNCQAYNKKGYQCNRTAVKGKRVCRYHGGLSLSGIASPTFKTGRHSKYIPKDLIPKYQEALQDQDLLNLKSEIQLIDARIAQLLERVEGGGGTTNWVDMNRAWKKLLEAQRTSDKKTVSESIVEINTIVNRGLHDAMIWSDIEHTIDRRQRLVSAESKRLTDMEQMISSEKALALIILIAESIRKRLEDYMEQKKIVDKKLIRMITSDVQNSVIGDS